MLADSSVGWLVIELVGELSFHDIIHVMKSHWIGVEMKWIVEILADTEAETLKPNKVRSSGEPKVVTSAPPGRTVSQARVREGWKP
jgi:hypothetical protein